MKLLITGACGFVGSSLAETLLERMPGLRVTGLDNLMRPGAETNRARLRKLGVELVHADVRAASDFENLPAADWIIDAAAAPSVLAGVQGALSSRQLFEHNLASLVNLLEYAKRHRAGFILLSSSRVYSIPALCALPLKLNGCAFALDDSAALPAGVSARGIGVEFSTAAPVSLYGGTKLACEAMALEYGSAFHFPVWVNRCGVLAGAGQFGTPDQGIFSYWVNAHLRRRPLRYTGFEGSGRQVRDAFHPRDLASLVQAQIHTQRDKGPRIYTAGGGAASAMSLAQLTAWCDARFGRHPVAADPSPRPYDIPWMIMDSAGATRDFGWRREVPLEALLSGVADHAAQHPEWLEMSGV